MQVLDSNASASVKIMTDLRKYKVINLIACFCLNCDCIKLLNDNKSLGKRRWRKEADWSIISRSDAAHLKAALRKR